jgi:uncharacterized protein
MRSNRLVGLLLLLLVNGAYAQSSGAEWLTALEAYWAEINAEYRDSLKSPLLPADRSGFTGLERYVPDPRFRVLARFKAKEGKEFGMPTTTDRRPVYRSVGVLEFKLHGRRHRLAVYQNRDLVLKPGYVNHLFVPFTDLTNGETTYGGGRYLDLEGPLGREVELDFNRAYNPYCAYGGRYSCPIPPKDNHVMVRLEAGVKAWRDH